MNAHDRLLAWCSERGSGTRRQLTVACRALRLPVHDAERALDTLGHVEFAADRWACTPTTLSLLAGVPERLLVTGHRPYGLLERLRQVADDSGHDVLVEQDGVPQPGGPETVLLAAGEPSAAAFCEAAGVRFCARPYRQIAELMPSAVLEDVGQPGSPDLRFAHCPLDPGTLLEDWDSGVPDGAGGLWAFREWDGRAVRYLRDGDRWWRFDDPGWAGYLTEHEERWCRYEPANRLLIVNAAAGLPRLAARAAALCSGRVPVRMHLTEQVAEDHYVGVDRQTAGAIIDRLHGPVHDALSGR